MTNDNISELSISFKLLFITNIEYVKLAKSIVVLHPFEFQLALKLI